MSKQGNMSYTPHATCAPTYGARRQHKLASHAHAHYNARRPRPCVLMHNVRTHARARNAHYQRRPRLLRLRRLRTIVACRNEGAARLGLHLARLHLQHSLVPLLAIRARLHVCARERYWWLVSSERDTITSY